MGFIRPDNLTINDYNGYIADICMPVVNDILNQCNQQMDIQRYWIFWLFIIFILLSFSRDYMPKIIAKYKMIRAMLKLRKALKEIQK